MTLVIAGIDKYTSIIPDIWSSENTEKINLSVEQDNGLFVVADSAITSTIKSSSRLLLSSFRKVYPIDIKLWSPNFVIDTFKDYHNVYYETQCFVAVAGRTLTIQHVLNSINEHLSKLRISYSESGDYTMLLHCDKNNRLFKDCTWDDDMFIPERHYANVYDANKVIDFIEYSISTAINHARKYKIDEHGYEELFSEYIVGIYCNKTKKHLLTTFRIKSRLNEDEMYEVYVDRQNIEEGKLAVIGLTNDFADRANQLYQQLLSNNEKRIPNEMFDFLNAAIHEVSNKGSKEIYYPSVFSRFDKGMFRKVEIYNPDKIHAD